MPPSEWWLMVDEYWDDLVAMVAEFHPGNHCSFARPMTITAPTPEAVRGHFAEKIKKESVEDPVQTAEKAKQDRDGMTLHRIFNQTWFGIPESTECWQLRSFGVLCDLCSEFEEYQDQE